MSSHFSKSIVQQITPFLGIGIMGACSFWRHGSSYFTDASMMLLCGVCLLILSLKISKASDHSCAPKAQPFFLWPLLCSFGIGLLYEVFIKTSLHMVHLPALNFNVSNYSPLLSLSTLFILTWASLIQKASYEKSDPVICYAYWPQSAVLRLPALISYYASSNGLFTIMVCSACFFLFDHGLSFNHFEQLDTFWITAYLAFGSGVILYLCRRNFTPSRPQLGLGILISLWLSHFIFMQYGHLLPPITSSFLQYKQKVLSITANLPLHTENAAISLPLSMLILWGVFWGSALSTVISLKPQAVAALSLGQYAGFYLSAQFLLNYPTIFSALFFGLIALNALRSKTPIHAIDCPWRDSKRLALKPTRWLMSMGLSPWIFCMVYSLSGKAAVFFVLHNFSLLVVLGLIYPLIYEIISYLFLRLEFYSSHLLYEK